LGNVMPSNKRPMEMLCDNEPSIAIINDPGILNGAKHFQRKYHYICEVIQECEIVLKKVHTYDNLADPVTKREGRKLTLRKKGLLSYFDSNIRKGELSL
ncbi:hypothetical protein Tco_0278877, partial [Tanacetum coccineum]